MEKTIGEGQISKDDDDDTKTFVERWFYDQNSSHKIGVLGWITIAVGIVCVLALTYGTFLWYKYYGTHRVHGNGHGNGNTDAPVRKEDIECITSTTPYIKVKADCMGPKVGIRQKSFFVKYNADSNRLIANINDEIDTRFDNYSWTDANMYVPGSKLHDKIRLRGQLLEDINPEHDIVLVTLHDCDLRTQA